MIMSNSINLREERGNHQDYPLVTGVENVPQTHFLEDTVQVTP